MSEESRFMKEAREKAGLTQRQVALALGYRGDGNFIYNIEKGTHPMPVAKIPAFAQLTGCSEIEHARAKIADFENDVMSKLEMSLMLNNRPLRPSLKERRADF